MDLHMGLVSGVTRQPLKSSIPTSGPQSTSATALNTSPCFPVRRCTRTSFALMLPIFLLLLVEASGVSCAIVEGPSGKTWTAFQADELDDWSKALKYDNELPKASCQAASSLEDQ
jgi:hypothetical protein